MKRIVALLAALVALGVCLGGAAQEEGMHRAVTDPDIFIEVELGYGGTVLYAKPMPIAVTIHNQGESLTGTVGVNLYRNQQYYDRYEAPVELPAGSTKQVVLPVTLQSLQQVFTVELVKDGQVLCAVNQTPQASVSPYALSVGVLDSQPQRLGYLNLPADKDELLRGEVWQTLALDQGSFPRDGDMLSAFGLIAVGDFDARQLDEAQRRALDQWLREGGILILGGGGQAQATYPYFEQYTGLRAGAVSQGPDITPALMAYVAMDGQAQGGEFFLNQMEGQAAVLAASQTGPLLAHTQVGQGHILTAAFELDAVAAWRSASSLWQRVLLTCAPQDYARRMTGQQQYEYDYWDIQQMVSSIPVENQGSLGGALAVLLVFVALAGPGAYLVLKKLDRRELMWGAIPLLTVAAGAAIWFMSTATPLNQPIAVSVSTLRLDGESATVSTTAGVSSPQRAGIVLSAMDGSPIAPAASSNYYADAFGGDSQAKEPYERMFRYRYGQDMAVEYPAGAPWDVNYLSMERDAGQAGQVTGSIWAQEDGLHAQIKNETPYLLEDGCLITHLGYVSIPQLSPGETVEAAILYGQQADDRQTAAAPAILDGQIWTGGQASYSGYLLNKYSIVEAIVYPERQLDAAAQVPRSQENTRQMKATLMRRVLPDDMTCSYVGFNDQIGRINIALNGQAVTRQAHKGVLSAQMDYDPVGPTGLVYYLPGMLGVYTVEVQGDGTPQIAGLPASSMNFDLSSGDQRMFGFVIPDAQNLAVEELVLSGQYVEGNLAIRLYNHQNGAWEEQTGRYITLTGEAAAPYIGEAGQVMAQAVLTGGSMSQGYGFVQEPFIQVKGRVK